jgi:hypothetical protein
MGYSSPYRAYVPTPPGTYMAQKARMRIMLGLAALTQHLLSQSRARRLLNM